ncbi:hypothetical protein K1719_001894 [Acacia pycnantha]|nr:hypothetical protein K1719_001894 [Acacia pycnantha]
MQRDVAPGTAVVDWVVTHWGRYCSLPREFVSWEFIPKSASPKDGGSNGCIINRTNKLRTGRASPGMLDHIIVEVGGVKMPLNRIVVVSVIDQKSLSVNPYDPQALAV